MVRGLFSTANAMSRNIDEGTTFTDIPNDQIILIIGIGMPVICHGLKNANHLNGKLGDLRLYHEERDRYEVHFEDKSLTPAFVRSRNLCIVFDLPDTD